MQYLGSAFPMLVTGYRYGLHRSHSNIGISIQQSLIGKHWERRKENRKNKLIK